jgi:excinuclease ABC subunit C
LKEKHGRSTKFLVPARGDNARLVELAQKNAYEEAQRVTSKEERISGTLSLLSGMLAIPDLSRIESYDISNISGSDIVASMVVFQDGRPKKSDYKKFKIEGLEGQDDYGSMRQVVTRRFLRYKAGDKGFDILPNLLLIDGGDRHASVALQALRDLDIFVPVVGMVKDDKHRTRALITPEGDVVHIDGQQSVFSFIGNIQEETHRFAILFHRQLRSKRLKRSELDDIPKIGPKRKEDLLRYFHSVSAIRLATLSELERLLPYDAAMSVYKHFHSETEEDVI